MEALLTVRAEIQLLPGEVSGKTIGYRSGVRPNHVFPGAESTVIGDITFEGREWLGLGEQCVAVVRLLYPDMLRPLVTGSTWLIHEGPRMVGSARVLEVVNDG